MADYFESAPNNENTNAAAPAAANAGNGEAMDEIMVRTYCSQGSHSNALTHGQ